jgi:hypothetical protein
MHELVEGLERTVGIAFDEMVVNDGSPFREDEPRIASEVSFPHEAMECPERTLKR